MRSLPLVLALIPGIALAKAPDWGAEGAGKVEIAGPVEVPLYLGQATKGLPAVWVTGAVPAEGAPTAMFASIDLTRGWTQVPEPVAKALGAKPKGGFAVIPELHIGDVVLRDVRAQVGPAFVIGVATLDELGVAMLPSKGVLKLVPADQAEALLSEVGTAAEAGRNGTKPYFEQGKKVRGNGTSLSVDGTIGGSTGIVYLRPDKAQTQVLSENPTWTRKVDGVRQVGTEPVVAGAKLGSVWAQENGSIGSYDGKMIGSIGFDALYAADVAVAPAAAKIAVKAVEAPRYANPAPKALEQAKAEFDAAEKAAAGAPEEKKPMEGADPGLPGTVGRETAYAGALLAAGQSAEAIEHYRKAVAVAGDACAPYHALGQALLATGNAKEAAPLFEKAGALWDKWYAQDVDTRDLIAAGKAPSLAAPAGKAPSDASFLLPQSSSCHKAWGDAAEAKLAMGDHAGVADLYAKHVDLDADLPLAYGLSLLAQGKAEAADGPIRQAMNLGASDEATRTALALASGGAVADRQVERVAFSGDLSFGRVGIVEAARKSGGAAAAAAAADELVKADPMSVEARLVQALEQHRQGKAEEVARSITALEPLLAAYSARWANHATPGAYQAVVLALKGDAAGAKSALEAHAKDFGPTSVNIVAQALVASVAGDGAAADAALATLRATDPLDALGWVDL